jgi:TPR repeat protein
LLPKDDLEPISYTSLLKASVEDLRARLAAGPEQRVRVVYAAAVGGSNAAQIAYGQMLLDGHGVARDPEAAKRWFRIAASAGAADGINMLGRCYERGWGGAVDTARAFACYRRAAARDHHWAQFNLATLMLRADPTPGEVKTALTLLVRSARQGNAKAMNMIGRYREFGWSGRVDHASATRWYRRAAMRGCFRGAAHLARFLREAGQAKDATHWYRRSIAAAPPDFCRDLAAHLFAQDDAALHALARDALRRMAEGGEASDWFAYGCALARGSGGPVNRTEARIWLHRAEMAGVPGALAVLDDTVGGNASVR